jgi:membrane fusion protein (multidrug efflux system)
LREIVADKGDVVKKDQIIAKIESPETDQQYQGAYSDAKNKRAIANRMKVLLKQELVSPQEAEGAFADAEIAESKMASASTLKSYEIIRAPFNGTVTARFVDPGALVQNAMNAQTGALPVVTVSQIDELRTYVYLDQRDATFVQVGSPVMVTLAERPGFQIEARITRISGELDPKTRMLLTEVDIDNQSQQLVAGSFVQVAIPIHTPSILQLPVEALVDQQGKNMVGVVGDDQTIHFQEVNVASNDGQMVGILSGVNEGQKVALSLGSAVQEGGHVRPVEASASPSPSPNATPGASPNSSPSASASPGVSGSPASSDKKESNKKDDSSKKESKDARQEGKSQGESH